MRNKLFRQIIHLVETFRKLMKSKQVEDLDIWIVKAQALEISEINSFVNGILRDIEAVKNAITYDYNNGLAEGKVNKIKVTKRIMYGRCGFKLLKEKLLRLEFQHQIN
jgi:transposase